ncbi:class I SAM-dependent methyltransferase [Campylobacter sp. RM3125]|uniref:class I SAM-dependent methyltransferase n=1 Tax=Campylobacter molothri TaxID=1032242 RepID=UPI00301CD860|nr:class I SAM-dependent methyltransferase [Campylobacter sp. RM3125]MBZ7972221.1 class I SAM-dependent methyltransferase [Campylobacter sp. RM3124]
MNTQEKWHEMHSQKRHQPRYPSSDLVAFVLKNFKTNDQILDLGCGGGRHVKFLAENDFIAYGVDYSKNGIKATQELLDLYKLKAELKIASVDDIPYEDEKFDGVICYGVLYYNPIELIEKAAKEIHRVLKKDGVAYIVVRNTKDYRYLNNEKISKYEVLVNENDISKSAFKENGMKMYFFDKDEVKRVFSNFRQIEINSIKISYINDSFADENFIVILRK